MKEIISEIPVDLIDANPYQPRSVFPEKAQRELIESIRNNGLLQPIVVRENGKRFQLIAGERRLRAFGELGNPTIPAIVKNIEGEEMRTLSLLENIQREDLNAVELAKGFSSLIEEQGFTQEKLAAKIGKDRSTIANTLRLLELPIEIQNDISKGLLSAGHGRALLPLKDSQKIFVLRDKAAKGISVRELERLVKKAQATGKTRGQPAKPVKDSNIKELEEKLSLRLATRVEIWGDKEGSIHIYFADPTEFNRIFNRILELEAE